MEMLEYMTIELCLSDIPKNRCRVSAKGKVYVTLAVQKLKEPERYENGDFKDTHYVYIKQSKEERQSKEKRRYCGHAKQFEGYSWREMSQARSKAREAGEVEEVKIGRNSAVEVVGEQMGTEELYKTEATAPTPRITPDEAQEIPPIEEDGFPNDLPF